jgi:hypothetical protein
MSAPTTRPQGRCFALEWLTEGRADASRASVFLGIVLAAPVAKGANGALAR